MLYSIDQKTPSLGEKVFVAPSADVIGDVKVGERSSIWFNCTVRGDVFPIRIGKYSNIQDNSVIHVTGGRFATDIGDNVTVGHAARIHGATLHEYSFIGISATVLDEAVIEPYGFVAAGALVAPRFTVPEKSLVAGVPAKVIRPLKEAEIEMITRSAEKYAELAEKYSKGLSEV